MSSKSRRLTTLSVAMLGVQALAFSAYAQQTTPNSTRDTTRASAADHSASKEHGMHGVTAEKFASQAAVLNKAEVELSQLALKNTKNEEIRIFAERMIKDHSAAGEKLAKIAADKNISLPQSLDAEHQAVKQKLSALTDDAFDREFRKEMAKGHDKAVALFESASQSQQMPEELRDFAASTLRTLEKHQDKAHDMYEDAQEDAG